MSLQLSWRDGLVSRACNGLLRLASRDYQRFVGGAIEYGMRAAALDEREGRPVPPSWRRDHLLELDPE